jgi:hypothetical protein
MKQLASAEVTNKKAIDIDQRFGIMNKWTFLMMQAFEARSFLDLAESTHRISPFYCRMASVSHQQGKAAVN